MNPLKVEMNPLCTQSAPEYFENVGKISEEKLFALMTSEEKTHKAETLVTKVRQLICIYSWNYNARNEFC